MKKQFGGKINDELIQRYSESPNWRDGQFLNLETTTMSFSLKAMPKFFYKQFFANKGREPKTPIPVENFDQASFLAPSKECKIIWFGHSVLLMRINDKTILIDPMFGADAAPVSPFKIKLFSENTIALIDQLPPIDLMLLSHDHYDHLDLKSMEKLIPKIKSYYVALGCARYLTNWSVDPAVIKQFDWWNDQEFEGINITFTPSRHFSGRGLKDRAKSLWGGWVFRTENENIYFSGDGGYGDHFKAVGEKLGPFDLGIMECGQYNENWYQIHMYPEEAIQAAVDSKANKIMAVHWAGFPLAQHPWKEPIERFTKAATEKEISVLTPRIGELFDLNNGATNHWWETHV
jgi:L-ascorbate metabolism protein UlaG (beta-lactamase superfamily)